jgi:hypothetical protein
MGPLTLKASRKMLHLELDLMHGPIYPPPQHTRQASALEQAQIGGFVYFVR